MINFPVILGRFQSPKPTIGHEHLINTALNYHPHREGLIIVGSTQNEFELRNPLPAQIRIIKLRKLFSSCIVTGLPDIKNNNVQCSISLDTLIECHLPQNHTPILFGSRDCFKKYYSGKFPIQEIEEIPGVSASDTRRFVVESDSDEFSAGIVYAINQLNSPKWEHHCNHCKIISDLKNMICITVLLLFLNLR